MKKLLLLALSIAVFAGCTKSEITNMPDSRAIGFDSFIGKATKAVTETTTGGLEAADPGFKVYGGYDGVNVFDGVNVSYNSGWSYSPLKYWVPGQHYKFAAYAPVDESLSPAFDYASGHLTISGYSITDLAQSKDLVYATADRDNTGSENTDPVDLTFGHIMSWVKIQFRHAMADGYTFTVSDVAVNGVKTNADFAGATGWTTPATPASFAETGSLYVSGTDLPDAAGDVVGTDFIAVPQTIAADNLNITFKLQVQDAAGEYLVGNADGGVLKTGKIDAEQVWQSNYVYVYTAEITAGMAGVKPIEFNPSVSGWGNTDGDGVIIIVVD